jgi:hypothetical protein
MELRDVGIVIARRELKLRYGKITVLIGKPEPFPDGSDYYCPYQIIGLGTERVRRAGGIDSIQALHLALEMIGADLHASPEAQTGELSWECGENGNLGFPVPEGSRQPSSSS